MNIVNTVFMGMMLFGESIYDIKYKKIPNWFLLVFGLGVAMIFLLAKRNVNLNCIMGVGVGIFLLIIGKLTEEAIGYGDAWTLAITGFGLGLHDNLSVMLVAVGAAAGISLFLLMFHRAHKKTKLPFIPFLFVGYLVICVAKGVG